MKSASARCKIPIGAAVRYRGQLGERLRVPPRLKQRGYTAVRLGERSVLMLPIRELTYVAKRYEDVAPKPAPEPGPLLDLMR